jgi:hypothetical protein
LGIEILFFIERQPSPGCLFYFTKLLALSSFLSLFKLP